MKKFLKSPWTISIGSTLLGFLLTVLYDFAKGKHVFSTIKAVFTTLYDWIVLSLNFQIRVWWILLALAVLVVIRCIILHNKQEQSDERPAFLDYTSDRFSKWKWSWEWNFSSLEQKWQVSNLHPHCPKCDTPMLSDKYESYFQCPRCKYDSGYENIEKSYEVEAVIIDNLDRRFRSGKSL